jgi:hypothetical protein
MGHMASGKGIEGKGFAVGGWRKKKKVFCLKPKAKRSSNLTPPKAINQRSKRFQPYESFDQKK